MKLNGQQMVFNTLNALKYLEEDMVDCYLIASWDSLSPQEICSRQ